MAFTYAWQAMTVTDYGADKPLTEDRFDEMMKNLVHLREWIGKSYYATATEDHDHDGSNSALVAVSVINAQGCLLDTEYTTSDTDWATVDSTLVYIPANVSTLEYKVRVKTGTGTGYIRLTCASADGSEIATGAGTYEWDSETGTLDVSGEADLPKWVTINVQGKQSSGTNIDINRAVFRLT